MHRQLFVLVGLFLSLAALGFIELTSACDESSCCCFNTALIITQSGIDITATGPVSGTCLGFSTLAITAEIKTTNRAKNTAALTTFVKDGLGGLTLTTSCSEYNLTCATGDCLTGGWPGTYRIAVNGWYGFGESEYKYVGGAQTWSQSETSCQTMNAHLTSINTVSEHNFVFNLQPVAFYPRWIGGQLVRTMPIQSAPFNFSWADGTPYVDMTSQFDGCVPTINCQWRKSEPDDVNGKEDCLVMGDPTKLSGLSAWSLVECSLLRGYVCERPLTCPSTIFQTSNYESTCLSSNNTIGAQCSVKCKAGFGGGSAIFTCSAGGVWSGSLTCSAVDCGETIPSLPAHASGSCANIDHSFGGDNCTTSCDLGYLNAGSATDGVYTCGSDGTWKGKGLNCTAVNCGSTIANLDINAAATCTGNTAFGGNNCTATCKAGYDPISGTGKYYCGSNGNWTGSLVCAGTDCGKTVQTLPSNASADCSSSFSTRYPIGVCVATCNTGYIPVSGSNVNYTCRNDGIWRGNLTCERVNCGSTIPSLSGNVQANCTGDTRYLGTQCQATCATGYVADTGNGLYTCTSAGVWSGSLTCKKRSCPTTISGIDPRATSSCPNKFYGDKCTISCATGYTLASGGTYVCGADGQWAGNGVCDKVNCGKTIQNLDPRANGTCSSTLYGDICLASCNFGYQLSSGNGIFICGADAIWSGNLTCERKSCGSVIFGLDAHAMSSCTNTKYQDTCVASCMPGYNGGSSIYTCGGSGSWSGSLTCTPKDCGGIVQNLPPFTSATCSGNTKFGGDPCSVNCDTGFYIKDESNIGLPGSGGSGMMIVTSSNFTCGTDGNWNGSISCEPRNCGNTILDLSAHVNADCTGLDTSYLGDTCFAKCDYGYLPLSGNGEYTCDENGEWVGSLTCQIADCGTSIPAIAPSATATCSGNTKFGGKNCTANCAVGYEGTSETFFCNGNGTWEGSIICTAKDCGDTIPSLPSNAGSNCGLGDTHYGSHCDAICALGYNADMGTSTRYTCNADGVWAGNLTCSLVNCGKTITNLDLNAKANCTGNTMYGGDNCIASCLPGFDRVSGTEEFVCGPDGNWYGDLMCGAGDCGATIASLDAHATANCSGDTTYPNGRCTASCNPGYTGGSTTYACSATKTWIGALTCSAVDCGTTIQSLPALASANCTGLNTKFGGDSCSIMCPSGYAATGTGAFTCGTDGTWTGTSTCLGVSCGSTISDLDKNAKATCLSTSYPNGSCQASCNAGYLPIGAGDYVCNKNGLWEGSLKCFPVNCGTKIQNLDPNAVAFCRGSTTYKGNNCKASCISGYTKISGSGIFTCGTDGNWSGSIQCAPVDCGSEIKPLHVNAVANCTGDTHFGGDSCQASCKSGYYAYNGTGTYVCGPAGRWIGQLVCKPKDCGKKIATLSENVQATCSGNTHYGGTSCMATCKPGYVPVSGTGTYTCSVNGTWTGFLNCTNIQCGSTIPGVAGTCLGRTYFNGDDCYASCPQGSIQIGSNRFICGTDGNWQGGCGFQCVKPASLYHLSSSNDLYEFFNSSLTWNSAEAFCQNNRSGHLTSISSKADNDIVFNLYNDPLVSAEVLSRWIGAKLVRTSTPQVAPFKYTWSDGTTFVDLSNATGFSNCTGPDCLWKKNEPNDNNGEEDCVAMGGVKNPANRGGWNDVPCNSPLPFVCKSALGGADQMKCYQDYFLAADCNSTAGANDNTCFRYSTLLNTDYRLFSISQVNTEPKQTILNECRRLCSVRSNCRGFTLTFGSNRVTCFGQSNLGILIKTTITSESYARSGLIITTTTTTTTTTMPSTTTTTTMETTSSTFFTTPNQETSSSTTVFDTFVTYEKLFESHTSGYSGPHLQFSTANDASKQLFNLAVSDSLDCETFCNALPNCHGFFFYYPASSSQAYCKGLSDVGTTGVTTSLVTSSWAKSSNDFTLTYQSDASGGLRFSNVFTSSDVIADFGVDVATTSLSAFRLECRNSCRGAASCQGYYILVTTAEYRCTTLSVLGSSLVSTAVSESWTKK